MKKTIDTIIGPLTLVTNDSGVEAISFGKTAKSVGTDSSSAQKHIQKLEKELNLYFNGKLNSFSVPLAPTKGTAFQKKVWSALTKIPFGKTKSYSEIAAQVGSPKAFRAVGQANNKNPLPIVVPCHRVIGKTGDLVGFASGVKTKNKLLVHEASI